MLSTLAVFLDPEVSLPPVNRNSHSLIYQKLTLTEDPPCFTTRHILSSRASVPIEMTVLIPIPPRCIAISPSETLALSVPRPPFLLVDDFPMDVSASWDCFPYDGLCLGTFFSPSGQSEGFQTANAIIHLLESIHIPILSLFFAPLCPILKPCVPMML